MLTKQQLTDFDESGDLKEFVFTLAEKKLKIKWENNSVEIELNIDEKEIEDLIEALNIFTQIDGQFNIEK